MESRKPFRSIIYEKRGGVSRIVINRPQKRNALNMEVRREMKEALREADKDESVNVVIVTGAGGTFCAGADIEEFIDLSPTELKDWIRDYGITSITKIMTEMDKPVIAAVDGYCLGGGCELALACDIVVATERSKFGQPEIRLGLIPGGGGTQRLPRLIGVRKAKELIYTGDIIEARTAEHLGLVNKVVPDDKLEEEAQGFAKRFLRRSPAIIRIAKKAINRSMETSLIEGLEYEKELFLEGWGTEDRVEGLKAFLSKRRPEFKGR